MPPTWCCCRSAGWRQTWRRCARWDGVPITVCSNGLQQPLQGQQMLHLRALPCSLAGQAGKQRQHGCLQPPAEPAPPDLPPAQAGAEGRLPHSHHYSSGAIGSGLLLLSRYPIAEVRGQPAGVLQEWPAAWAPAGASSVPGTFKVCCTKFPATSLSSAYRATPCMR